MQSEIKVLLWPLVGPYGKNDGEPWRDRLPTVGEILRSDAYDFLVLPGVSAPKEQGGGFEMMAELMGQISDYSYTYTRHIPNFTLSDGLLLAHRYSRWEADLSEGFRIWPPKHDRVLFCVGYHELDEEKKRTGRGLYLASCQAHSEEGMDAARERAVVETINFLAKRPHPEYPVIWAGDFGAGAPSTVYDYVTGHPVIINEQNTKTPIIFQDPLPLLYPNAAQSASINNWRDYVPEGGVRRDFVFISDGLTAHSLDFNYVRTPGGQFPSNHYPQRAVLSFNMAPMGQVLN